MTVAEKEPPPPVSITPRQREVYDWIVTHCEEKGYAPTIREIAKAFDVNHSSIAGILKHLVAKEWLSWSRGKARTFLPIGGTR